MASQFFKSARMERPSRRRAKREGMAELAGREDASGRLECRELRNLLGGMQPGAVLFLHLFDGTDLPAKAGELGKFLLDGL